jgi:hypothetical protein
MTHAHLLFRRGLAERTAEWRVEEQWIVSEATLAQRRFCNDAVNFAPERTDYFTPARERDDAHESRAAVGYAAQFVQHQ